MDLFSKKNPSASFPIDSARAFTPNKAFYITQSTEFALTITLADVSGLLFTQNFLDFSGAGSTAATAEFLKATKAAAETTTSPTLTLTRPGRFSLHWTAKDAAGTTVAELSSSLLALGRWTISFPAGSVHSDHDIPLRPAGAASRADEFVKDSVPYYWDVVEGRKLCKLYKAMDGRRVEVGRFVGEHARAREGLVLLETQGGEEEGRVDEVVGALTCIAVLNRSESFRA